MTVSPLSAYRQLLRATRIAFQGSSLFILTCDPSLIYRNTDLFYHNSDDYHMLYAARAEARRRFDEHRRTGVDTPMHIQHAIETANILRHNIVQGVRDAEKEDAQWRRFPLVFLYLSRLARERR